MTQRGKNPFITLDGRGGGIVIVRADLVNHFADAGDTRILHYKANGTARIWNVKNSMEDIAAKIQSAGGGVTQKIPPAFIALTDSTGSALRVRADLVYSALSPEKEIYHTELYLSTAGEPLKIRDMPQDIVRKIVEILPSPFTPAPPRPFF
jgi:hypothetical protein